jgi:hypothetical protein
LYFSGDSESSLFTLTMPAIPFPSLQTLTLNGSSIVSGIEFLQTCLRSSSVTSVGIISDDVPSSGELPQLTSALASNIKSESLTSLYMGHPDCITYETVQTLVPSDFDPLLQFSNIEDPDIRLALLPERLSDSLLEAMSVAWPRLRYLHFNPVCEHAPSQCTFHGILSLLRGCPRMCALAISFMASTQISWNGRPGDGVVGEHMESLDVWVSPIVDPSMVAMILSDICPNLHSIEAWDTSLDAPEDNHHRKLWQQAIELYAQFVQLRTEERVWAARQGHKQLTD